MRNVTHLSLWLIHSLLHLIQVDLLLASIFFSTNSIRLSDLSFVFLTSTISLWNSFLISLNSYYFILIQNNRSSLNHVSVFLFWNTQLLNPFSPAMIKLRTLCQFLRIAITPTLFVYPRLCAKICNKPFNGSAWFQIIAWAQIKILPCIHV